MVLVGGGQRGVLLLRRFRRPVVLLLVVVLLLAVAAGSFVLGFFVRVPERDAVIAANQVIPVTAEVRRGVVDSNASFAGQMNSGQTVSFPPSTAGGGAGSGDSASGSGGGSGGGGDSAGSAGGGSGKGGDSAGGTSGGGFGGGGPVVVTRRTLSVGDVVESGTLLGIVSGVPYFVLQGPLPLYRNLGVGDEGDDVSALQVALNTVGADLRVSGRVNYATLVAVRELYVRAELDAPSSILFQQLLPIVRAGRVVSVAEVGDLITGTRPLVTAAMMDNYASFRADVIAVKDLKVGGGLMVRVDGSEYSTVVSSIGGFSSGDANNLPGHVVSLSSTDPKFLGIAPGTVLSVRAVSATEETLMVPLTAVRGDSGGAYVFRVLKPGSGVKDQKVVTERVPVRVLRSGEGLAAVGDGALQVGDVVLVS